MRNKTLPFYIVKPVNPETTSIPVVPTLDSIVARSTPDHAFATKWAADVLRTAMTEGALDPGTKLSEAALAQQLGISRNTLRQAFTALESEHLMTRVPNRGVFVATPGKKQIHELFTLRLALESGAIDLISAGEKPVLRRIIEQSKVHRASGSVSGMAGANQDFHRELVRLSGSERLNTLMTSALAEMRLLFHSMVTVPDFHSPFVEKNEHLMTLLEAGNKQDAHTYLRDYLASSAAYFADRV